MFFVEVIALAIVMYVSGLSFLRSSGVQCGNRRRSAPPGKAGGLLDAGDLFPEMHVRLTSGEVIDVPDWFKGAYGVFLVYRGHW
ncbi:hypothetical protein [Desulfonatronum parangueonense]